MSRISFTSRFFLKHKNSADHLYVRITVNRKSSEISLKRNIDKQKWDDVKQKVKGSNETAQSLNQYIGINRSKLNSIHSELLRAEKDYSAKKIKDIFLGNDKKKHFILQEFYIHNQRIKVLSEKGNYAKATYLRYNTSLNHLSDFVKYNGDKDITFNQVSSKFIHDFDYFLRTQKNLSNNTTIKHIKFFKKIFLIAIRNGWVDSDPFVNYRVKLDPVNREHLSLDELRKLANKDLHINRLGQVRDIFLFACFTGLRYSDVKQLNKDHISVNIDGSKSIIKKIKKSNRNVKIPILPPALKIIEKYKDDFECKIKGVCLPVPSNQKINAYLKEIAVICGIHKNLTFHIARHTFATISIELGLTTESVKAILGHSDLATTQIYGKITDKKVMSEMNKLKTKFKL